MSPTHYSSSNTSRSSHSIQSDDRSKIPNLLRVSVALASSTATVCMNKSGTYLYGMEADGSLEFVSQNESNWYVYISGGGTELSMHLQLIVNEANPSLVPYVVL